MVLRIRAKWFVLTALMIFVLVGFNAAAGRIFRGSGAVAAENESVCVPIIVYHNVQPKRSNYSITPGEFESDLQYLAREHYTAVTMNQLMDYVSGGESLPTKPIVLSFDDGYLDNYRYVYPLIKKYDTQIVLSIIAKNTDDFTQYPDDNLDYSHVTWTQLKEMADSGLVDVENHTYNLHSDKNGRIGCMQKAGESYQQYEKILSDDLMKCQNEISVHIGSLPATFTYPYGKISKNAEPILKELGFRATLTCNFGVNRINRDPACLYDLKRICRMHGKNLSKAIAEGMKTLKYQKAV